MEKYPDGGKQRVYSVNSQGKKVGAFKEFYPNGKLKTQARYRLDKLVGQFKQFDSKGRLQLQANYRDGDLDGARQEYVDGRLVKEEIWLNGVLLAPRSTAILAAELKAIQSLKIQTVGKPPQVSATVQRALDDSGLQAQREAALRMLMAYRCVCGLPYRDMKLDWTYTAHAEAASALLTKLNKRTHTPENPGLPEDEYRFAAEGAGSSNLYDAPGLVDAVNFFLDDSNEANIERLGHRRWCLNPAMAKTGFGGGGKFAAMWAPDCSRSDVPDYEFVAFPPRGYVPVASFHDRFAWSLSLNLQKFQQPNPDRVKVKLFPVQFKQREHKLARDETPLPLNYFHISLEPRGTPNCIIFRPANFKVAAGETFTVCVSGLSDVDGHDAKVEYLVAFVKL